MAAQEATLEVTVIEAKGLPAMDKSGTSDPYAVVSFGKSKAKTAVQKGTLTPSWKNEKLFLCAPGFAQTISRGKAVAAAGDDEGGTTTAGSVIVKLFGAWWCWWWWGRDDCV